MIIFQLSQSKLKRGPGSNNISIIFTLLSFFLLSNILLAQKSDLEIVESLVAKNHVNIRAELNELGLTYTQKKQSSIADSVTKYIFFINGTEGNIKPWEIYTRPINTDSNRITEIIIKYYYNSPGDLLELDRFIPPGEQVINESVVSYEKSEGKKQAHIKVSIIPIHEYQESLAKTTGYYRVYSPSKEALFLTIDKKYSGSEDAEFYSISAMVKGVFSCSGIKQNYLQIKFIDNDSLYLKKDVAEYICNFSVPSSYFLSNEDFQQIATTQISTIKIQLGENIYEFQVDDNRLLMNLVEQIGVE